MRAYTDAGDRTTSGTSGRGGKAAAGTGRRGGPLPPGKSWNSNEAVIPAQAGIQWFRQDIPACLQAGITTPCAVTAAQTGKSPSSSTHPGGPFLDSGLRRNEAEESTGRVAIPIDLRHADRPVPGNTPTTRPPVIPAKAGIQWFRQDIPACLQAGITTPCAVTAAQTGKSPSSSTQPGSALPGFRPAPE